MSNHHRPCSIKNTDSNHNHSAHTLKETRAYLTTVPNRFDFVFTPKHASWLNLIERFFAKLSKQLLHAIRVQSREELEQRIIAYLGWPNQDPVQKVSVAVATRRQERGRYLGYADRFFHSAFPDSIRLPHFLPYAPSDLFQSHDVSLD